MGNTRRARAGGQQRKMAAKEMLRSQQREIAYLKGLVMSLQAQLSATKMERPADLEDWIEEVLPDMSEEERAEWDALDDDEREALKDSIGVSVNTVKLLNALED